MLMGTEKSLNVRDFQGLSLILPMDSPEGKYIQLLENYTENLESLESEVGKLKGDRKVLLHEALWQCQTLFNEIKGKVGSKRIWLFTTNDNPHVSEPQLRKQALKKGLDLRDTDINLEVIPYSLDFDFSKFYSEICFMEDSTPNIVTDDQTQNSEADVDTSVVANKKMRKLDDMLTMVRKRIYKKRSVGKFHLDLGNDVKMSVSTYNFVQKASKPSKVRLTRDTNEEVKVVRQFIDPNTGAPLLPSDVSKYMEYGKTKIKFSKDEVRATQKSLLNGGYGLKLLCFKPKSQLKWSDFVRSSHFIYPDDTNIKGSRNIFAAFHQKCYEREVIGICSFKAREVSAPTFVGLEPQLELKDEVEGTQVSPPGFRIFYLPFSDDYRKLPDPMKIQEPNEEQLEAAKRVIKKLRMKNYDIEQFENPSLQAHFRMIESLALFKTDEEDPGDTTLPDLELQGKRLCDRSRVFMNAVEPSANLKAYVVQHTQGAGQKRANETKNDGIGAKKTKKDVVAIDTGAMEILVNTKKVDSLKVDELKAFLMSVGNVVTGKKKAQLVADVYDHFVI